MKTQRISTLIVSTTIVKTTFVCTTVRTEPTMFKNPLCLTIPTAFNDTDCV